MTAVGKSADLEPFEFVLLRPTAKPGSREFPPFDETRISAWLAARGACNIIVRTLRPDAMSVGFSIAANAGKVLDEFTVWDNGAKVVNLPRYRRFRSQALPVARALRKRNLFLRLTSEQLRPRLGAGPDSPALGTELRRTET